MQSSFQNQMIR